MGSAWIASADVTAGPQRCLWERSPQDLMAIYLPHMLTLAIMLVGICAVYDPTMKMLLYNALPNSYQNWLTFWLCYMEEMRFLAMIVAVNAPAWQCQIIAFDLVNHDLEAITEAIMRMR